MKRNGKIITLLFAVLALTLGFSGCASAPVRSALDYSETTEAFSNPDTGFYKSYTVKLTDFGLTGGDLKDARGLIRLNVGLGQYCNYKNAVRPLSDGALDGLKTALIALRQSNSTALLCFSYDDFESAASKEPSLSVISEHIRQLSPVFYDCEDVITAIKVSFIGTNGSFLSSALVSDENMYRVTDDLLAAAPPTTRLLMRSVRHVYGYLGLTLTAAAGKEFLKNSAAGRLGVFDDNYASDARDGDFYLSRSDETAWLYRLCDNAFFGGRAAVPQNAQDYGPNFVSQEMFVTHTAFLDGESDGSVLSLWKAHPYGGSDKLFVGKSYYDYIAARLGYRLLLKDAAITAKAAAGDEVEAALKIENLGAGSVIRDKRAEVILSGKGGVFCFAVDMDITALKSLREKDCLLKFKIGKDTPAGEYKVYLRLAALPYAAAVSIAEADGQTQRKAEITAGGGAIRFANTAAQFDTGLGGNLIGAITVK